MNTNQTNMPDGHTRHHFNPPATGTSHLNVGNTERVASLVGGALMAYYGLKKTNAGGLLLAAAAAPLLFRGATGYCPLNDALGINTASDKDYSFDITRSLTVQKPRHEVYQYWRQLENLPKFMEHLQEVRQLGPKESHWVARVPKGIGTVEWDASIIREEQDELIEWRSKPGADVDNAGEVRFSDAPNGQGTVVQATISYRPPVGVVGGKVAEYLNSDFERMVANDLQRFKHVIESRQNSLLGAQHTA
ncbi:SRPBCC family protein [Pontibacter sp. CAU 1760]